MTFKRIRKEAKLEDRTSQGEMKIREEKITRDIQEKRKKSNIWVKGRKLQAK